MSPLFMSDIMLKQRFLKNSARVITVATVLLFASNAILWLLYEVPSIEGKLGFIAKLPDLSVYIFAFLSYLALNDEKAAHRKIKDIKSQKKVKALKGFLLFVLISHFFKGTVKALLSTLDTTLADVLADIYYIVASFSFFLLLLSVWYFFRDKNEGKIKFAPLISIIVSCAYVVFKLVVSREENTGVLLQRVQYTFCLVQYAVNILMLVLIKKHYEKKENEQGEKEGKMEKPQRPTVISLETDEGYGIDSIDDLIE